MKKILYIVLPLFLSFGYSQKYSVDVSNDSTKESQQMLHKQSVIEIEELVYAPTSDKPFSGIVWWRGDGYIWYHQKYTDGRRNGFKRGWYNGQKVYEENYKNGVTNGKTRFSTNAEHYT